MKIFLDTKVLISAFVFGGIVRRQVLALLDSEHEVFVSQFVDNEFRDKLNTKWADVADDAYTICHKMDFIFCESTNEQFCTLRDKKDEPVLNDAIFHKADILLTGDRDLLEANIVNPVIISPTMLQQFINDLY